MTRRLAILLLALGGLAQLAGCGFQLRGAQRYDFESIAIQPSPGGPLATELRRTMTGAVKVLSPHEPLSHAHLVLEIIQEQREKTVVGVNSSGQVREFQLRSRVHYRVKTPQGVDLVTPTEIVQKRDLSFSESASLAKEAEEALLYRDMQTDLVQQLLRRLAAIRYASQP